MSKFAITVLGLVLVATLSGCSSPITSTFLETGKADDVYVEPANPLDCVAVKNIGNKIKLNQPRFSGDPDPTDIFVVTRFSITNSCNQAVIGLKGTETFQNVVGDVIFSGNFTSDLTIQAGASAQTSGDRGYTFNQFEDAYGTLGSTDQAKTLSLVELSKIVFADGTTLDK
jgi:hypothetical protein